MERHRRLSIIVLLTGSTGMLYTLWHFVAVKIVPLANRPVGSRLAFGALASCCRYLFGEVGLCEQLWRWVALSQPPSCDGFQFYCHVFRFGVAGEDVPDLKRAGSRIDWRAIRRSCAVPQSVTPMSVALSPIGDQYEGHVSKVRDVKRKFLVANRVS